jgi:hypothetical protein
VNGTITELVIRPRTKAGSIKLGRRLLMQPRDSTSKPGQCCFELFRVMQLVPQGFHDQTDQSIRNGIRR